MAKSVLENLWTGWPSSLASQRKSNPNCFHREGRLSSAIACIGPRPILARPVCGAKDLELLVHVDAREIAAKPPNEIMLAAHRQIEYQRPFRYDRDIFCF